MTTPNGVNRYKLGELVALTATIIGTDGVSPAQPSWFAFVVLPPNGSTATYAAFTPGPSVLNPTTGAFVKYITIDQPGSWFYRSVSTGLVQSAEEWAFLADPSPFFAL